MPNSHLQAQRDAMNSLNNEEYKHFLFTELYATLFAKQLESWSAYGRLKRVAAVERSNLSVFKYSEHIETSNFLSAAVWSRRKFNSRQRTRDATV